MSESNQLRKSVFTYLEFGSIDLEQQKKNVYDFRLNNEAYDFFMLSRYMKDLIVFKNITKDNQLSLKEKFKLYEKNIHTKDLYNSFSKLGALHVCKKYNGGDLAFLELGSTIMGCIEAILFLQEEGKKISNNFSSLKLTDVKFKGIDISKLLNDVGIEIHPGFSIETFLDYRKYNLETDVFFAKGVSLLYTLHSIEELLNMFRRAKISSFDYSFSLSDLQLTNIGTGKVVSYLPIREFFELYKSVDCNLELVLQESTIEIDSVNNRVRFNGYFGEKNIIDEVISEENRLKEIFYNSIMQTNVSRLIFYNHKVVEIENDFIDCDTFLSKYYP